MYNNRTLQWLNERIRQPWDFMRWFRLAVGIYLAYESFISHELMPGLFSAFFLYQSITATGCCGVSNSCSNEVYAINEHDVIAVEYEEVVTKPISKNNV